MPSPFATPLLATFLSVLEAVLVCSAGALLTRCGVLTPAARHALARIGFYMLLPALTFVKVSGCGEEKRCYEGKQTSKNRRPSKQKKTFFSIQVAEAVDATTLADYWPLLANGVLTVVLGGVLGLAAAGLTRAPEDLVPPAVAAATIGNASIVPLLVVASLCQCDGLAIQTSLGRECGTRGVAYVAVGGAVASVPGPRGWLPFNEAERVGLKTKSRPPRAAARRGRRRLPRL